MNWPIAEITTLETCQLDEVGGIPLADWHQITRVFQAHPEVQEAVLFGSRAKGNYRADSDIDLAIIANDLDFRKMLSLKADLLLLNLSQEDIEPDLVNYLRLEPMSPIRRHIDRVGIRVYDRQTAKVA